jgi:hypothetical protein
MQPMYVFAFFCILGDGASGEPKSRPTLFSTHAACVQLVAVLSLKQMPLCYSPSIDFNLGMNATHLRTLDDEASRTVLFAGSLNLPRRMKIIHSLQQSGVIVRVRALC